MNVWRWAGTSRSFLPRIRTGGPGLEVVEGSAAGVAPGHVHDTHLRHHGAPRVQRLGQADLHQEEAVAGQLGKKVN